MCRLPGGVPVAFLRTARKGGPFFAKDRKILSPKGTKQEILSYVFSYFAQNLDTIHKSVPEKLAAQGVKTETFYLEFIAKDCELYYNVWVLSY